MNREILLLLLLPLWGITIAISLVLWIFFIRPYMKANGRCRGDGPNYGWAMLADASIASEIAKETKEYPIFLRIFWISEILLWAIPVTGVILVATAK